MRDVKKTADELARIMTEHLAALSPEERAARIAAGQRVLVYGTAALTLTWSAQRPTEKGEYWHRDHKDDEPRILHVYLQPVESDHVTPRFELFAIGHEEFDMVDNLVGQWAGPIVQPMEA